MTNGVRDRRADADGREQHHDVRELEHRLREAFAERQQRPTLRLRQKRERDAEHHAEHDDLQHLAVGNRLGDVLGKDMQDDVLPRLRHRTRDLLSRRWRRQVDPHPRAADRDRRPPDEQRKRRDDLEVHERLDPHAPNLFQVAVAGYADDERREEQRGNDGANQPDEDLAEDAELDGGLWEIMSECRAGHHRDENPRRQRPPPHGKQNESGDDEPSQREQHAAPAWLLARVAGERWNAHAGRRGGHLE